MSDTNIGPGGTAGPTPAPPRPLYPDTPWWASLIAVFVTAVVSILGTAYALGAGAGVSTTLPPAASLAIDTITYMPHIILLFGVLADMFSYDGVWSIPSLVGILSIFLNYFMQYFWKGLQELFSTAKKVYNTGTLPTSESPQLDMKGGAGIPGSFFKNYDGCSVQGFDSFSTEFAPQTLVVTSTVFFYYIFDLVRNRGWLNSLASILVFASVYIGQVAILGSTAEDGSCSTGRYGHFSQALMALFEGVVFGGSSYGIVQAWYPTRLPSSTISPFPRRTAEDLTTGADGKLYDSLGIAYVVLPNGQTAPDLSAPSAREAIGGVVDDPECGSGKPALPASCST